MKIGWLACFGTLALALIAGCAHKVTEADLIGNWRVDAASVPNGSAAPMAKDTTLSLTGDHQFVMAPSNQIQIKGAWGLTEAQVVLTPMTVVVSSPFEPGKTLEIPVAQAVQAMKSMSAPGSGQKLDALTQPISMKVAPEGKTLTSPDNVIFQKG